MVEHGLPGRRRQGAAQHPRDRPRRAAARSSSTSTRGSCSSRRCREQAQGARAVGRRAVRTDGRRAGADLRRRALRQPPVHVGGQAALLRQRVLQLAVHVRAAVRHRPVRGVPRRPRASSASGYDDLLSATGLGSAAALPTRFDIDVTDEALLDRVASTSSAPASTSSAASRGRSVSFEESYLGQLRKLDRRAACPHSRACSSSRRTPKDACCSAAAPTRTAGVCRRGTPRVDASFRSTAVTELQRGNGTRHDGERPRRVRVDLGAGVPALHVSERPRSPLVRRSASSPGTGPAMPSPTATRCSRSPSSTATTARTSPARPASRSTCSSATSTPASSRRA